MLTDGENAPSAVVHDNIRLLPEGGPVQAGLTELAGNREALVGRKIALEDEKAAENAELTVLQGKVKDLSEKLDAARDDQKESVRLALDKLREEVAQRQRKLSEGAVRIGLIDSTTAAIDKFTASLQTTADGATRSPLASAVLREQLHPVPPARTGPDLPMSSLSRQNPARPSSWSTTVP